jgi:hypothetical protein
MAHPRCIQAALSSTAASSESVGAMCVVNQVTWKPTEAFKAMNAAKAEPEPEPEASTPRALPPTPDEAAPAEVSA